MEMLPVPNPTLHVITPPLLDVYFLMRRNNCSPPKKWAIEVPHQTNPSLSVVTFTESETYFF